MSLGKFGVVLGYLWKNSDEKRLLSEEKGRFGGDSCKNACFRNKFIKKILQRFDFPDKSPKFGEMHPNLAKFDQIPRFLHEKGKKSVTDGRTRTDRNSGPGVT